VRRRLPKKLCFYKKHPVLKATPKPHNYSEETILNANKWWNKSNVRLEVDENNKIYATPVIKKRVLLVQKDIDKEGNLSNEVIPITRNQKTTPKSKKVELPSALAFQKRQSLLMTPSQSLGHSRKLLQMKTVGVLNPLVGSRVKEEHDMQNLKPSAEFFSRLNYVHQLKEDRQGLQAWSKSFSEAINDVKIQNKEFLKSIHPKFKRRFAQLPGISKKTIVFGLDRVLVKTNFEKDRED
jgi:hypothetical protein